MSIRLNKVLTELNIGLQTAVEFLKNKKSLGEIGDDAGMNTKISDEQYQALVKAFKGDKDIKNEADNGLRNRKYTIAMARTSDPHSATAQFFINVKDNSFLDHRSKDPQGWGYAVFGKVIRGQDVVDQIAAVKTGSRGYYEDVPMQPVIIKRATIVE